jgi:hypothetical protein
MSRRANARQIVKWGKSRPTASGGAVARLAELEAATYDVGGIGGGDLGVSLSSRHAQGSSQTQRRE